MNKIMWHAIDMHEVKVDLPDNHYVFLKWNRHNSHSRTCYLSWAGEYEVEHGTRGLSSDDINDMIESGLFGVGQCVNATLEGTTIRYSGVCDSGD